VLILGALVGWKRVDVALEAIALARRDRPDLRLKVAGTPLDPGSSVAQELVRRLRTRADQPDLAGAVEFLGPVAEPAAELRRATCLLHCAEREPFGLAVAEALAAGRPAVVPTGSGPAEIVDAGCGITYPPSDAQAAAQAILALVDNPQRAAVLGAHGRERAATHFDATDAATRFAAAIAAL
jgi:glycosyltransferase involved in cell wall biosynthesis